MPLYLFADLKAWLKQHQLAPRKKLSQHFLVDGQVVEKILRSIPLNKDPIIEIGPGPGVLTEAFFARGQRLLLIEADRDMAPLLQRFEPLEIYQGDALGLDLENWLCSRIEKQKASLVSNLPYHLSSAFFKKWLMTGLWIQRLVVMVQKEFAQKVEAKPGEKGYGPLSVYRAIYVESIEQFDVPAQSFYPAPKVVSSLLHIRLKEKAADYRFQKILEHLFTQRRKQLSGVIKRKEWQALESPWDLYNGERIEQIPPEALWAISSFLFNALSEKKGS